MNRNVADGVTLIGKLGSAPEIKPTANGQMLTLNLGVQVTSWATDEGGQRQTTEKTRWHRVISFSPRIIRCAQGLEKDDTIVVRGCPMLSVSDFHCQAKSGQLSPLAWMAICLDPTPH